MGLDTFHTRPLITLKDTQAHKWHLRMKSMCPFILHYFAWVKGYGWARRKKCEGQCDVVGQKWTQNFELVPGKWRMLFKRDEETNEMWHGYRKTHRHLRWKNWLQVGILTFDSKSYTALSCLRERWIKVIGCGRRFVRGNCIMNKTQKPKIPCSPKHFLLQFESAPYSFHVFDSSTI